MIAILGSTGCVSNYTSPSKPYIGKPLRGHVWDFKRLSDEQLIDLQNCVTPYIINKEIIEEEDFKRVEIKSIWTTLIAGVTVVGLGVKAFLAWMWPF